MLQLLFIQRLRGKVIDGKIMSTIFNLNPVEFKNRGVYGNNKKIKIGFCDEKLFSLPININQASLL